MNSNKIGHKKRNGVEIAVPFFMAYGFLWSVAFLQLPDDMGWLFLQIFVRQILLPNFPMLIGHLIGHRKAHSTWLAMLSLYSHPDAQSLALP
jgi:fatty acid desaturase